MNNTDLHSAFYYSRAVQHWKHVAEFDILIQSQARNARLDVTGYLRREGDVYMQILEGSSKNLHKLLDKIAEDKRHSDFTLVSFAPIAARQFDAWSLGYDFSPSLQITEFHENFLANPPQEIPAKMLAVARGRADMVAPLLLNQV